MKPHALSLILVPLFIGLAFLQPAQAVVPSPDGGYPGFNTAEGQDALFSVTSGATNTAIGFHALYSNTTGDSNTAAGANALVNNQTGRSNTATGFHALNDNTFGIANTATGVRALDHNQSGGRNTAIGYSALSNNTSGIDNIGVGYAAGIALTTGSHNIAIGAAGQAGESDTIRLGDTDITRTFVAGIRGVAVNGLPVVVGGSGQLGVAGSSRKFKDDIKPMEKASEAILALKPVTFHYKKNIDPDCTAQFGLVAEDVEKVNPDLVVRDEKGKPYSVRYDQVNAMLLNEFLKEHRKVQEQEATIARLNKTIDTVLARLDKQDSKIQGVSDQVKMTQAQQIVLSQP
jgi:Chaperone of endosialidase